MKNVSAKDLREIAFAISESDYGDSIYFYTNKQSGSYFYIYPCQNGWHVVIENRLLGLRRSDFCVPTEDIFDIVDGQELVNSILEITKRQVRMARNRVEQLREIKKQLV